MDNDVTMGDSLDGSTEKDETKEKLNSSNHSESEEKISEVLPSRVILSTVSTLVCYDVSSSSDSDSENEPSMMNHPTPNVVTKKEPQDCPSGNFAMTESMNNRDIIVKVGDNNQVVVDVTPFDDSEAMNGTSDSESSSEESDADNGEKSKVTDHLNVSNEGDTDNGEILTITDNLNVSDEGISIVPADNDIVVISSDGLPVMSEYRQYPIILSSDDSSSESDETASVCSSVAVTGTSDDEHGSDIEEIGSSKPTPKKKGGKGKRNPNNIFDCDLDLPPIQDLKISVKEEEAKAIGTVYQIVENKVVIQAYPGIPAIDIDSVLFLDSGQRALGVVFDVFGHVQEPLYVVRFNSSDHVKEKDVQKGTVVYFAPQTDHTSYIILDYLLQEKGTDASWKDNRECPSKFADYSDDEEERKSKAARRKKNKPQEVIITNELESNLKRSRNVFHSNPFRGTSSRTNYERKTFNISSNQHRDGTESKWNRYSNRMEWNPSDYSDTNESISNRNQFGSNYRFGGTSDFGRSPSPMYPHHSEYVSIGFDNGSNPPSPSSNNRNNLDYFCTTPPPSSPTYNSFNPYGTNSNFKNTTFPPSVVSTSPASFNPMNMPPPPSPVHQQNMTVYNPPITPPPPIVSFHNKPPPFTSSGNVASSQVLRVPPPSTRSDVHFINAPSPSSNFPAPLPCNISDMPPPTQPPNLRSSDTVLSNKFTSQPTSPVTNIQTRTEISPHLTAPPPPFRLNVPPPNLPDVSNLPSPYQSTQRPPPFIHKNPALPFNQSQPEIPTQTPNQPPPFHTQNTPPPFNSKNPPPLFGPPATQPHQQYGQF